MYAVRWWLLLPNPLTVSNATVTGVVWTFEDTKTVLAGSTGNASGATLTFKSQASVSALAPATVTVTALITLDKGGTTYKVAATRTIKFQNMTCCDGAVIVNGAYNYVSGSLPGDGAKAGGALANGDASWSPNLSISEGAYNATAMNSFFTAAGTDLCVYKTNGNSKSTTTWVNAVNNCANGSYTDGDASAGWYLPNERELQAIYNALGGSGSSAINFSNLQAPSYVATTAEDMVSRNYWSSTENSSTAAYILYFSNGDRVNNYKTTDNLYVRCVRRM
jgi:hypothetical protein